MRITNILYWRWFFWLFKTEPVCRPESFPCFDIFIVYQTRQQLYGLLWEWNRDIYCDTLLSHYNPDRYLTEHNWSTCATVNEKFSCFGFELHHLVFVVLQMAKFINRVVLWLVYNKYKLSIWLLRVSFEPQSQNQQQHSRFTFV